ncbi:hypothetical protein R3P38DRAFT_2518623 [Favolaschia claudopus]|uniref:SWIM-type domain-containing protein n=1 Tax=Favolaschia claudopus TaxID=2862362 RepID=A0AAW0C625_9AGAR
MSHPILPPLRPQRPFSRSGQTPSESPRASAWSKIQGIAPTEFIAYLKKHWMSERVVAMWSAVHRACRTIFEQCDTNMPIEAWHHVLKDKFLHGKRNRRLDHLLHILVHAVLPYYALKQRRQDLGLEGPDAEVQKRRDIEIRGATYTADDIALIEEDGVFKVTSQSDPSRAYDVDLKGYTCTCFDFPGISFCKHLCAVQRIFGKDFHDHLDNNDPHTARPAITQVRSLLTVADPDPDAMERTGAPMQNLAGIADEVERLAARLRLPPTTQILDDAIASLQSSRGAMFLATDDVSILPSKQRLAPVVKCLTLFCSKVDDTQIRTTLQIGT